MAGKAKIATAYVAFSSNYKDIIQEVQKVTKEVKEASKEMDKAVGDTTKAMQELAKETNKAQKDMQKSMKDTTKQAEDLGGSVSKVTKDMGKNSNLLGSLLSGAFSVASVAIKGFSLAWKGLSKVASVGWDILKGVGSLIKNVFVTAVDIGKKAVTGWLNVLSTIPKAVLGIAEAVAKLPSKIGKTLNELTKIFVFLQLDIRYILAQFRTAALLAGGAIVGVSFALGKFEDAFVRVRKVTDMTNEGYERMQGVLSDLSQEVDKSASELSELAAVGGQLGIEGVENLEAFTSTMSKLQMTTNVAGEEGAAQFARLMTIMGIAESDMERMGSTLVELGNNFAAFENEILNMTFRIAGAGRAVGLSMQEVFGLSTALSAAGVRAERGGSAVSRIMMEMANAAADGGEILENFAEITNLTTEEMEIMIKETPIRAIQLFIKSLRGLNDAGENVFEALEKVNVNQIRTRDVILRLVAAEDLLNETVNTANEEWLTNSAMQEEVNTKLKTTWSQIKLLKDQLMAFARSMGSLFEENVKGAVTVARTLLEVLNNLDESQMKVIKDLLKLVAVISTLITGLLLATKAFFTFLTGLMLIGRFVAMFAPIVLGLMALKKIMSSLGLEETEAFKGLWEDIKRLVVNTQEALDDLGKWIKSTDTFKAISKEFRELLLDLEEIKGQKDVSIGVKFLQSSAEIAEFLAESVEDLNEGIQRARDQISDSGGLDFVDDKAASAIIKFGKNLGKLIVETMELVFIQIPGLLWDIISNSQEVKDSAKFLRDQFKDKWDDFTDYTQANMPNWIEGIKTLTLKIENLDEEDIVDFQGTFQGIVDFWDMVTIGDEDTPGIFADEQQREEFVNSIKELLKAIADSVASFFGEIISQVLEEIDWVSIFTSMMTGLWQAFAFTVKKGVGALMVDDYQEQSADITEQYYGYNRITDKYKGDTPKNIFGGNLNEPKEPSDFTKNLVNFLIRTVVPGWEGFSNGALLSGYGGGDQIAALLEAGEAVVPKEAVRGGMSGVAQWFKDQNVPGFKDGTTGDFIANLSDVSPFSAESIQEVFDNLEDTIDILIDKMDKWVNNILKVIRWLVDAIFKVIKLITPDKWADRINEIQQNVLNAVDSIIDWTIGSLAGLRTGTELPHDERRGGTTWGALEKRTLSLGIQFSVLEERLEGTITELSPWQRLMKDSRSIIDAVKNRFIDLKDALPGFKKEVKGFFDKMEGWFRMPLEYQIDTLKNALARGIYGWIDILDTSISTIANMIFANSSQLQNLIYSAGSASGWEKEEIEDNPFAAFIEGFSADPIKALINMVIALLQQSGQFEKLMGIVNDILSVFADVIGAILEPLMPVLEALAGAVLPILQVFAMILAKLLKPLEILVPIFEFVGDVFLKVAKIIARVWNLLVSIIDAIPFVDMRDWYINLDELTNEIDDFKETTEDARESLKNVPEGFKYALEKFRSADPDEGRYPGSGDDSYEIPIGIEPYNPPDSGSGDDGLRNIGLETLSASTAQSTSPPQIIIQGDIYGWDNFKDKVAEAYGEIQYDKNMSDIGVGTV